MRRLGRAFYRRPSPVVAPQLLNKILAKHSGQSIERVHSDFDRVDGVKQQIDNIGFCAITTGGPTALVATPTITPVSTDGASPTTFESGFVTTGQGFGMYINGHVFIFQLTGGVFPAAGTKWTLRSYAGIVRATTGPSTATPSGYTYTPARSSPAVPGLKVVFDVAAATSVAEETDSSIARVHTVPDPYYVTNAFETTTTDKIIKFVNLLAQAIIRIYSSSGVLVNRPAT